MPRQGVSVVYKILILLALHLASCILHLMSQVLRLVSDVSGLASQVLRLRSENSYHRPVAAHLLVQLYLNFSIQG